MENTCPYCAEPSVKERTILEDALVWSFPTNIPIVPGHVLIATQRCVASFEDLTDAERTAIFAMMSRLMKALEKTYGAKGFNVAWNQGELAGQSIPHFHLHLLPRREGDAGITEYEPRKFLYWTGSREASVQSELLAVAHEIQKNL